LVIVLDLLPLLSTIADDEANEVKELHLVVTGGQASLERDQIQPEDEEIMAAVSG
jgi:hypothetical protein